MAREFQNSFEDLARETELDELRKQVTELRDGAMRPLADMQRSVESPASTSARAEPQADETGDTPKLTIESPAPAETSAPNVTQSKEAGPV
jgi:sec-independent protein translocase protein TatB